MLSHSVDQSLHHLHLDQFEFKTLAEVPDSHAWPSLCDHCPCGSDVEEEAVPVIDLASPDAVDLIGRACEDWGAFQVTGHGVPVELLDRLEAQTRRLFSLPTEQKLKAARSPGGVTGYGLASISAFFSKLFWSEGFTIVGSPRDAARKLWPHDGDHHHYADFCDAIEEYGRRMKAVARRLVVGMLTWLGLSEEDIDWAGPLKGFDEVAPVVQLNSYPACPDPNRAMGLAEHTDSSLVTILYQGSVSGLQLLHGGGGGRDDHAAAPAPAPARWVTVPPIPGALVVNVGDLSQVISNGRFRSVMHRVVVNRARTRVSAAYFCGPPAQFKVSPIEKLVCPRLGPAYRAVTWPEYLSLKRKLYNGALASIRLPEEDRKNSSSCEISNKQLYSASRMHGEAKVQ